MPYWYKSGKILKKCVGSDFQSRHIRLRTSHMGALYGDLSREKRTSRKIRETHFFGSISKSESMVKRIALYSLYLQKRA